MRYKKDEINQKLELAVNRLAQYCMANPYVWHNRNNKSKSKSIYVNEKNQNKVIDLLTQAKDDYKFIARIAGTGNLPMQYKKTLQEAGVGGIFGIPEKARIMAIKHRISKVYIEKLIKDFGTLEDFKNRYVEYVVNRANTPDASIIDSNIRQLEKDSIIAFDLTSPNYIYKNDKYIEIFDDAKYEVFDGTKFREIAESYINTLSPREKQIIELYYYENKTLRDIAKKYNVSFQNIDSILNGIKNRFMKKQWTDVPKVDNEKQREDFIRSYFKNHDVFIDNEKSVPTEAKRVLKKQYKDTYNKKEKKEYTMKNIYEDVSMLQIIDDIEDSEELESINALKERIELLKDRVKDIPEQETNLMEEFTLETTFKKLQIHDILTQINDIKRRLTLTDELNLSPSVKIILRRSGISTLENILSKDKDGLEYISFITEKQIQELLECVHSYGYTIKGEELNTDAQLQSFIQELEVKYQELGLKRQESDTLTNVLFKKIKRLKMQGKIPSERKDKIISFMQKQAEFIEENDQMENLKELLSNTEDEINSNKESQKNVLQQINNTKTIQRAIFKKQQKIEKEIDERGE